MELLIAELPMLALIFVKNLRPGIGLGQTCCMNRTCTTCHSMSTKPYYDL